MRSEAQNGMEGQIHEFAQLLQDQQRARLAVEAPNIEPTDEYYSSKVTIAKKYARVDFGGSGKYMIDLATGEIFGIKAYGVIHRGHRFGTLDTIHEWDWSGYGGWKR